MASKKEEITFELLVMTGGDWRTHNVYTSDKINIAMGDAKALQNISTTQSVKLIKEFYDEESGGIRQRTMYESEPPKEDAPNPPAVTTSSKPKPKKPTASFSKPRSYGPRNVATSGSKADKQDSKNTAKEAAPVESRRISGFMIFVQIMFALLISLGAAILVTTMASQMLKGVTRVSVLSKDDILVGIFILVFVFAAAMLIVKIVTRTSRAVETIVDHDDYTSAGKSNNENKSKNQKHDPRLYLPAEAMAEMKKPHYLSIDKESENADAETDNKNNDKNNDGPSHSVSGTNQNDEKTEPLPLDVISTINKINKFVTTSLKALEGGMSGSDPYASFGVSLYMIGATHALCQESKIRQDFNNEVLGESLRGIGLSQDRINYLISRSDEYLVSDPRYLQMYQVGRSAMGIWLESGIGAQEAFAMSYENWIKPRAKPTSPPPVIVLFTDIAGSTAMTQERGDEGAQEIVREHNRIVREALAVFQGREVKHTGDGIMASFSTGVNGVEAAIDMQRKVKEMVENKPELPLKLKIGINVGEPISEDNDLFGSTVQLAARIVDKANPGEILISEAVRGLTQGKKIPFKKHDEFEMKGFEHPIATYRVVWEKVPTETDTESNAEPDDKSKVEAGSAISQVDVPVEKAEKKESSEIAPKSPEDKKEDKKETDNLTVAQGPAEESKAE